MRQRLASFAWCYLQLNALLLAPSVPFVALHFLLR